MYYTYVLLLNDGSHYVGYSANLKQRITQHLQNTVKTTKNDKVDNLIFYAAFSKEKEAINFEKYLKSSSGFAFRKKHLGC